MRYDLNILWVEDTSTYYEEAKEILEALNEVLKKEFKNALNEELEQNGYEVKEAKDKSEIEELKFALLEVLKK